MASVDGSKSTQQSSDNGSQIECSPCDYEGIKKEAKYFCLQCKDYLCDTCKLAHQKFSFLWKHQLVSGSLMPMKRQNNDNLDGTISRSVQCSCNGKDITLYCKDHNKVMCVDCKTFKHRNCNCLTIAEACTDLDTPDTNATKERMKAIKSKLEKLQQRRNEDLENLTTKSADCRDRVEEFKRELIKKIEDLADNALDDIAKCDKEQRLTIEQHLNTFSTALSRVELGYKPFEEAVIAGINSLIFVHNLQLKKTFEQVDSILQDLGKEVKESDILFDVDERLRLTDIQSLGIVRYPKDAPSMTDIENLGVEWSTTVKDTRPVIADMKIRSVKKMDVKFAADQSEPWITGSLFLPNGKLCLCDHNNSSLKVINADFTQKEKIKLSSSPWDLCLLETDEIVITQPNVKLLLFMKVVPKLQTGSSITLDQDCWGVAVKDGLIYVSFNNGEIRVLDRTGQQQRNVYSGLRFKLPGYIYVMPTGMLYVSEFYGNNIRVLKDGKEISNYSNTGISSPRGMYIHGAGNILLCEYYTNNLRIIDTKGQTSKVLLSGTDGLYSPLTVNVRPNDNTLIVGGVTQKLIVCKMVVS